MNWLCFSQGNPGAVSLEERTLLSTNWYALALLNPLVQKPGGTFVCGLRTSLRQTSQLRFEYPEADERGVSVNAGITSRRPINVLRALYLCVLALSLGTGECR